MPANTSPEYKKAEAAFRRARDPGEKLELLREMLRTIPKHKGTEHMRADIKTRIKELSDATAGGTGKAARSGPATVIRPEGAGQIALVGPPNSGKSALHTRLTGSHTAVGDYPFTTQYAQPGMLDYEDVHIQLVDLPAISTEHPIPWIANALQTADGCLLVVDLSHAGCMTETVALHDLLAQRRIHLVSDWPGQGAVDDMDDPLATVLPTLLVAAKADLLDDPAAEIAVFEDLTGLDYDAIAVSATTGDGIASLADALWQRLGVVRVYTKIPGHSPDMSRPFTVHVGDTVYDVAQLVHRDIAAGMRYARVWNGGEFDGRQVGPDHVVSDGEVVELHV